MLQTTVRVTLRPRPWRLLAWFLAAFALVWLSGRAYEHRMLGRTDEEGRRLVADGVRQEFGGLRAALEQAAGAASRHRDLMLRAPARPRGGARPVRRARRHQRHEQVAITVYGSDAAPLAWSGRPSELPGARISGPAALLVAPGASGLRLVLVQPGRRGRRRAGQAGRHRRRRSPRFRPAGRPHAVSGPEALTWTGAPVPVALRPGYEGGGESQLAGRVRPDRPRRQVAPRGPGAHRRCRGRPAHGPGPDARRALRADGPVPGVAVGAAAGLETRGPHTGAPCWRDRRCSPASSPPRAASRGSRCRLPARSRRSAATGPSRPGPSSGCARPSTSSSRSMACLAVVHPGQRPRDTPAARPAPGQGLAGGHLAGRRHVRARPPGRRHGRRSPARVVPRARQRALRRWRASTGCASRCTRGTGPGWPSPPASSACTPPRSGGPSPSCGSPRRGGGSAPRARQQAGLLAAWTLPLVACGCGGPATSPAAYPAWVLLPPALLAIALAWGATRLLRWRRHSSQAASLAGAVPRARPAVGDVLPGGGRPGRQDQAPGRRDADSRPRPSASATRCRPRQAGHDAGRRRPRPRPTWSGRRPPPAAGPGPDGIRLPRLVADRPGRLPPDVGHRALRRGRARSPAASR